MNVLPDLLLLSYVLVLVFVQVMCVYHLGKHAHYDKYRAGIAVLVLIVPAIAVMQGAVIVHLISNW